MDTKKVIIIVGSVVLLVAAAIGAYSFFSKAPKIKEAKQADQKSSTATGDLTRVTPGATVTGRNSFAVFSDPLNPFAANAPRSSEPLNLQPNKQSAVDFSDYNKALADGKIPDKNGMYAQRVTDTSPLAPLKNQNYDFTAPPEQFLGDYYPQAGSIIAGNLGSEDPNFTNPDDPLTSPDPTQNLPNDIALVAGVDPKIFKTKSDNSSASIIAYAKQISDATAEMDLIHDDTFTLSLTELTDLSVLSQLKTTALSIQSKIKALTVPVKLLGLAQAYYLLHGQYANLVDDQTALVKAKNDAQINAALQQLNDHAKAYGVSDGQVRLDAMIIRKMIQQ